MRILFLILLVLAARPTLGVAQQAAPEIPALPRDPGVTVTLSGYLNTSARGELMFPPALLERVSGEPALRAVDTSPVEGRIVLAVRFAFASVGEFQRWYANPRTVQLIDDIRAVTVRVSFETLISYRPAAAQ